MKKLTDTQNILRWCFPKWFPSVIIKIEDKETMLWKVKDEWREGVNIITSKTHDLRTIKPEEKTIEFLGDEALWEDVAIFEVQQNIPYILNDLVWYSSFTSTKATIYFWKLNPNNKA